MYSSTVPSQQPVPDNPAPPAVEALIPRLWNLTGQEFRFQFSRRRGAPWSREFTLKPDEYAVLDRTVENADDLEGLHDSKGRAIIQYPDYGGKRRVRLNLVLEPTSEKEYSEFFSGLGQPKSEHIQLPYMFIIEDADGHFHLLRAQVVPLQFGGVDGKPVAPRDVANRAVAIARESQSKLLDRNEEVRRAELARLIGETHLDQVKHSSALITNHVLYAPDQVKKEIIHSRYGYLGGYTTSTFSPNWLPPRPGCNCGK
jgi:hypothetical protein